MTQDLDHQRLDSLLAQLNMAFASDKCSPQRIRIVNFITDHGWNWSIGELAHAMGLEKSTVSARVNECLHAGELQEKPKRADRRSGIRVRPVGLPELQMDLFGGEQ